MCTVLSIEPVASKGLCGAKAQVVTYLQIKKKSENSQENDLFYL